MDAIKRLFHKHNKNPFNPTHSSLGRRNYLKFEEMKSKFPTMNTSEIMNAMVQDAKEKLQSER